MKATRKGITVLHILLRPREVACGSRERLGSGNTILNAQSDFVAWGRVGKSSKDLADVIQLKCRADTCPQSTIAVVSPSIYHRSNLPACIMRACLLFAFIFYSFTCTSKNFTTPKYRKQNRFQFGHTENELTVIVIVIWFPVAVRRLCFRFCKLQVNSCSCHIQHLWGKTGFLIDGRYISFEKCRSIANYNGYCRSFFYRNEHCCTVQNYHVKNQ